LYRHALCLTVRGLVRRYGEVSAIAAAGKRSLRRTVKRACRSRVRDRVERIWQAARESVAPRAGQGARHQAMVGLLVLALIYALARDRAVYQAQRCVTGDGTADGLPALQGTPAQLAAA
jgi:hypothetical protein